VDTVPAAHMVTMTDNDNGINDENALPLPEEEDNLQGPVRRGGAVPPGDELRPSGNPVPGRLQNSVHYLARREVHATLAVASASMATSLPTPRPRP